AATIEARQKILRSVVKEVLVGRERVVIRHSIPVADHPFRATGYRLRLRSPLTAAGEHRPVGARQHFMGQWESWGGQNGRSRRRAKGLANYRIIR
ncbi:MAG: hypothetical protein ABSF89_16940, partial [Acidimicrobiales bacterium]